MRDFLSAAGRLPPASQSNTRFVESCGPTSVPGRQRSFRSAGLAAIDPKTAGRSLRCLEDGQRWPAVGRGDLCRTVCRGARSFTLGAKRDQIAVDQAARFSATADGDLQCDVDGSCGHRAARRSEYGPRAFRLYQFHRVKALAGLFIHGCLSLQSS
jgi:hypothetical protein